MMAESIHDARATRLLVAACGTVAGVSSALIVVLFGTVGVGLSVVVVAALAALRTRRTLLAAYFTSIGLTWIGLLARAALTCDVKQISQGCEQPTLVPLLLVAAAAIAAGAAIAFVGVRTNRTGS